MAERAASFRALHLDFGTGDGAFVRHAAVCNPDTLVIGVDAATEPLRDLSRRFAAKRERGGLPNALLGRLALADAPGELAGLADRLTVLLPWGSLLRAVASPVPASLGALRALCKPGAELRVLYGYGPETDGTAIRDLALPPLDDPATASALAHAYRGAGFRVALWPVALDEIRALPSTWAKRLAFSRHQRRFVAIDGRAEPLVNAAT